MSPSPNSIHRNSQRAYEAANHQGNRELVVRVVRERAPIATWQIEEALQAEGHKAMHQTISATVSGLLDIGYIAEVGHCMNRNRRRTATLALTGSDVHRAAVAAGRAVADGGRAPGATRATSKAAPSNWIPKVTEAQPPAPEPDRPWKCTTCGTRHEDRFVTVSLLDPAFGEVSCSGCIGRKGVKPSRATVQKVSG